MTTEITPGKTADGTPPGAGTTADGSLSESERNELEALKKQKDQWLGEKTVYEQTKAEKEALAQQVDALTRQPPTTGVDQVTANVQAKYQELLYRAQVLQDPDAQFQLALIAGNQQQLAQARRDGEISALPADEQDSVKELLRKNPNFDVALARQIVQGQNATKRVRDYEAKEEEARRVVEEQTRASGAGVTAIRPAPNSEIKTGTMKASAFNAQMAALKKRVDDGDRGARQEALALGRKVDSGDITLILNE